MRLLLPSMPELHAFLAVAQVGSSAAAQTLCYARRRQPCQCSALKAASAFVPAQRPWRFADTDRATVVRTDRARDATLADAVASVQAHASPRGVLRLRTVSTLSMRWLVPRLPHSMRACQACA